MFTHIDQYITMTIYYNAMTIYYTFYLFFFFLEYWKAKTAKKNCENTIFRNAFSCKIAKNFLY